MGNEKWKNVSPFCLLRYEINWKFDVDNFVTYSSEPDKLIGHLLVTPFQRKKSRRLTGAISCAILFERLTCTLLANLFSHPVIFCDCDSLVTLAIRFAGSIIKCYRVFPNTLTFYIVHCIVVTLYRFYSRGNCRIALKGICFSDSIPAFSIEKVPCEKNIVVVVVRPFVASNLLDDDFALYARQ